MRGQNPIMRRLSRIKPSYEEKIGAEVAAGQKNLCAWVRETAVAGLEIIAFCQWWDARMCLCIHNAQSAYLWDFSNGRRWNIFAGNLPREAYAALTTVIKALQDDDDPYISVSRTAGDCICRRKRNGTMKLMYEMILAGRSGR